MTVPDSSVKPMALAVLISGGGTTLKNLIDRRAAGSLRTEFRLVISSKRQAGGVAHARAADIPVEYIARRMFDDSPAHSKAVFDSCRRAGVNLVVMAGYLEHLLIAEDFQQRVINIHPSLIPAFCGKGFYGIRVHQAALDYGAKVTGCTVHYVDNQYDHGPIIAQQACAVDDDDTAESLQARVFQLECELLPQVINAIAEKRVIVDDRRVRTGR